MLPRLDRLALVPTGGNLANAKWDEDEVCSICTFPLARPSEDERYTWPFSGDGTGFTTVACVQGHTFHKGCLRYMQRFNDTKCPDCRKPMFKEVLQNVSRPDAEQLERERRQAAERERARAQREREDREAQERRRNLPAPAPAPAFSAEYEVPPDISDYAVQWSFFVKGHIPTERTDLPLWRMARGFFERHMRAEWAADNPIENWGQRLGIHVDQGNATPRDMPEQPNSLPATRCRFRLHLPEAVARRFADWLTMTIGRWGYVTAMDRVLGIRVARQAGQAVAVMTDAYGADTDATIAAMNSQENASLGMTWQEYQEWLPFAQRPVPTAARAPAPALVEYEAPQVVSDSAVQWTFFIKGHIPTEERIWDAVRAFFNHHMRAQWPWNYEPVENWGRRLGIALLHGEVAPIAATHASMRVAFTRCRFRLHAPEAAARRFADWLGWRIHNGGYRAAMEEVLGMTGAIKAGPDRPPSTAVIPGYAFAVTPETQNVLDSQANAIPNLTWLGYQQWPHFEYRAAPSSLAGRRINVPDSSVRPQDAAPAQAPQQQANWMLEEAMDEMRADDPITNFRPPGGADTDVTIRWRFWLKGPMSGEDRSDTPEHWRRSFADLMREPGLGVPTLRTSQDPWYDRLWVWTRAEEPHITGPRSGQPLVPGLVQRCEFALKLPADVASAWLTIVAQAFGSTSWDNLAQTWFYVEPVRSNAAGVDRPQRDSSTLHPLTTAPGMTEAEYNAWEPWRNIQRFRAIGDPRY